MTSIIEIDNDYYIFSCPHCEQYIKVHINDTNCCIFRHAVHKNDLSQINPHASKEECEKLLIENKVFGCAKPFRIKKNDNKLYAEICDYI